LSTCLIEYDLSLSGQVSQHDPPAEPMNHFTNVNMIL